MNDALQIGEGGQPYVTLKNIQFSVSEIKGGQKIVKFACHYS